MSKLEKFVNDNNWNRLTIQNRANIEELDTKFLFSHAEIRQLIDIARDLEMWDEDIFTPAIPDNKLTAKQKKQRIMKDIHVSNRCVVKGCRGNLVRFLIRDAAK